MITVLQRQRVSKRPDSPVLLRARSNGVRWTNREMPAPAHAPARHHAASPAAPRKNHLILVRPSEEHSFLKGQLVRGKRHRAIRLAPRRGPAQPRPTLFAQRPARAVHAPREPGRLCKALLPVLRSPWLLIGMAVIGATVALVSMLGLSTSFIPQARPQLPSSTDVDATLYGLVIPDQTDAAPADVSPVVLKSLKVTNYTTTAGDTLSKVASRFRLNIDTVVSWNGIRNARSIAVGTVLQIPNANGLKYTVRRGDTLQGIARSWGVDFNNLVDFNQIATSAISVGQELFLPNARMNQSDLNKILGSLFMYPVLGSITLSSPFGTRPDPFTGLPSWHNGIDIKENIGTAILAAAAGTIADVGFNPTYGNYVIIKHSGGYQTLYGHMTRYLVTRGLKVTQGQKIGEVGTTGYSTGPHVHFSVFHNGEAVDPLKFLK
jgi:murein DD-endopeptidase MepM/ murein hydrolase activator NlpD